MGMIARDRAKAPTWDALYGCWKQWRAGGQTAEGARLPWDATAGAMPSGWPCPRVTSLAGRHCMAACMSRSCMTWPGLPQTGPLCDCD